MRPDGSPYDPVSVRVVVSRYPRTSTAEHGVVIQGWQYELFAADLSPEAWPANEVVAAYFGRCGMENRFAQEDRELDLDRTFSFHLPGQELACLVGLFAWNLQVVQGFLRAAPPPLQPVQSPWADSVDPTPVPTFQSANPQSRMNSAPVEVPPAEQPGLPPAGPSDPPSPTLALPLHPSAASTLTARLRKVQDALPWAAVPDARPEWSWDSESQRLRCPENMPLHLSTVQAYDEERLRVQYRGPVNGCSSCERRTACFPSAIVTRAKLVNFHVRRDILPDVTPGSAADPAEDPTDADADRLKALQSCEQPRFAVLPACFLPAEARHTFRNALRGTQVEIRVDAPIPHPRSPVVATGPARRQHRRLTWTERLGRNAIRPGTEVYIAIRAPESAFRLLALAAPPRETTSG